MGGPRKSRKRAKQRSTAIPPPLSTAPLARDYSSPTALLELVKRWISGLPGGKPFLLLCGVCSLIVSGWTITGVGRSLYEDTIPRVHVFGSNPNDPFALPFTVTNPSDWFDMKQVAWTCFISEARSPDGRTGIVNLGIMTGGSSGAKDIVARKQTDGFRCRIGGVANARITAQVRYKTLWFDRTPVETEFTWISGRWFEGKLH